MSLHDRLLGQRPRSRFIVGLLVLALIVSGLLTYQAWDAARSHAQTAQLTLQHSAAIATWDLGGKAQETFYAQLVGAFEPIYRNQALIEADRPFFADPRIGSLVCECITGSPPLFYFQVQAGEGGRVLVSRGAPDAGLQAILADSLAVRAGVPVDRPWELGLAFPAGPAARGFAFMRRTDERRRATAWYGFAVDAAMFRGFFENVLAHRPLLPASIMEGLPNDSLLAVSVLTPGGAPIYQSSAWPEVVATAEDTLPPQFGGLIVRVGVRPKAAGMLVIGGLPRSRLPLLMGLLLTTTGLIVVALLQLRREAELARLREDFVSGVSHELRTPLAQIRMFTETLLLGRVRTEAERRRSLEIIDKEARRLTHLVENVLRFARSGRKVRRLALEPTDLAAEVHESVEGFVAFADVHGVELRPELQERVMAVVDRGALRQILVNLLDNAIKYGPAGQRVVVGLALFGDAARIWVDDEGPGIPAGERDRVFAPFYRSERDAGSAVAGSGIGLAVVRELARLHGGRSWAEEAPGGGARIAVEIPGAYLRPAGEGSWVAA